MATAGLAGDRYCCNEKLLSFRAANFKKSMAEISCSIGDLKVKAININSLKRRKHMVKQYTFVYFFCIHMDTS